MDGGGAVTPYKQRFQFITTYIPGLAGLSERESILAQPTLRRQAASGDAGGVLRNILLNLRSRKQGEADDSQGLERLAKLNELVSQVHPGVQVNVAFDEREDYHISATLRTDDLLDYSGNSAELGKNIGDDLREGKPTLPLLAAMSRGTPEQREMIRNAIIHGEVERMPDIVEVVKATGALQVTREAAQAQVDVAKKCLAALPPSEWREALLELSLDSIHRSS